MFIRISLSFLLVACISCTGNKNISNHPIQLSGIYPHLAMYNQESECGTGAVVPWGDRLWVMTYSPHSPNGSSDKLYEITPELEQIVFPGSIGGTPANRMIHQESQQLFMGPYVINQAGEVRVIPYSVMPGRHTANARHLFDPANKLYVATMEEGLYEIDVHSLEPTMLYKDGHEEGERMEDNEKDVENGYSIIPGDHGKGLYAGQGVLVYSNNGATSPEAMKEFDAESGVLAEWDGHQWTVVRRNQFVEVSGPGGILGNPTPDTDPIWATGWDHKSLLVGVRSSEGWAFYRLPKASHSYDGAHGWNTEWPRIRDVGTSDTPDYLMTMHGMFWRFPGAFGQAYATGIRPRSAYLKVVGDMTRWKDKLVLGCDDSAKKEFLNKRSLKGGIEGPGQSNSNLWFIDPAKIDQLGPTTASGAIWLDENIESGEYSDAFLFAGWEGRTVWIHHRSAATIPFTFEVDINGTGHWEPLTTVQVPTDRAQYVDIKADIQGEWIRVYPQKAVMGATVSVHYSSPNKRPSSPSPIFHGLSQVDQEKSIGGLLYGLGEDRRALGLSVQHFSQEGREHIGYYELDVSMNLRPKNDPKMDAFIQEKFAIPPHVLTIDASSALVVDDQGRRWRFPLGKDRFTNLTDAAHLRLCREVATERDLFNCHGTFYELPAENADGFAKVRPIASHDFRIHDYASYRGLLVMTGIDPTIEGNEHLIRSKDGKAAVWAGAIDDLWELGKPHGRGGPWKDTPIQAGIASDPYLMGFYDQKSLTLSHDAQMPVSFRIEVEPIGHGPWMLYREITVAPGGEYRHTFPDNFEVRWIRFVGDQACKATAYLVYK
ncbi:MAG: hypothetical protein AAF587_06960 [Bacteroidota bacterium]